MGLYYPSINKIKTTAKKQRWSTIKETSPGTSMKITFDKIVTLSYFIRVCLAKVTEKYSKYLIFLIANFRKEISFILLR